MIKQNKFNFKDKNNNNIIIINNFDSNTLEGNINAIDVQNPKDVIAQLDYSVYGENRLYMASIKVGNGFKQSGIGSALIYCLEHFAKSNNIQVIEAYMNNYYFDKKDIAQSKARTEFYKALNFEITKQSSKIYTLVKTQDKFFTNKNNTKLNISLVNSNTKK